MDLSSESSRTFQTPQVDGIHSSGNNSLNMLLKPPTGNPAERMLFLDEGRSLRTTIDELTGSPTGSRWTDLPGAAPSQASHAAPTPGLALDSPSRASDASLDSLSTAFWPGSPSARFGDDVDSPTQYRQLPRCSSSSVQNTPSPAQSLSLTPRPSPRQNQYQGSPKMKE